MSEKKTFGKGLPPIQSQNSKLQDNYSIKQSKKAKPAVRIKENAQMSPKSGKGSAKKKNPNFRVIPAGHFKG